MFRLGIRALMALIGVAVFLVYAAGAALVYLLLVAVWTDPTSRAVAIASVVALTLLFGLLSYRFGTRQLLVGLDANELPRARAPWLYASLERLCERMELDVPTVYVASLEAPNALALGGFRSGALVLDPSLFRLLDAEELEAIVAHELAHLESYDGLVQTVAYSCFRTIVGLLTLLFLPVLLLAAGLGRGIAWLRGDPSGWPATGIRTLYLVIGSAVSLVLVALTVLIRTHSRRREFAADDRAAEVTGNPRALANALYRIEQASKRRWSLLSPLYVVDESEDPLLRWFSTHPPVEERIQRLQRRAIERESGRSPRQAR